MDDALADSAKAQVYDFFFSAVPTKTERGRSRRVSLSGKMPYANLRKILNFDSPSFISTLNEAFEDSFLNPPDEDGTNSATTQLAISQKTTYNRQFIVKIMLEVMAQGFDADDTIYLDMFIARNLPKYTQYMLLSGTTMQEVFTRLCHYPEESMRDDAQLSVEYLLAVYRPSNLHSLVPLLHEAEFFRVLKSVYRKEHQYPEVISMFFADSEDQETIFDTLLYFLRDSTDVPESQKARIIEIVREHAQDLTKIDVQRTATTIDEVADHFHRFFLDSLADDSYSQYDYLTVLFESEDGATQKSKKRPAPMLELYIRLMCQFNAEHVPDFVDTIKEGDLRLDEVLPAMEKTGIIDAAVILQTRSGHVKDAVDRLTDHLSSLQSGLRGLLGSSREGAGPGMIDSVKEMLSSIEKYAQVGIWLCQGQSKILQGRRPVSKSSKRSSSVQQPLSFEEGLWLSLIESVVAIARDLSKITTPTGDTSDDQVLASLRSTIQKVFTALLMSTTSARASAGASDMTFLHILRAFLSNAAKLSPSLAELRAVLNSVFSAYSYEESLLALSNSMIEKDVFVHVDNVKELRQKGWRPRGQVCEVCRRRVWGSGLGERVWEAWEKREQERRTRRDQRGQSQPHEYADTSRGKGKAADPTQVKNVVAAVESVKEEDASLPPLGPVVVFSCRHLYHVGCLRSKKDMEDGREGHGHGIQPGELSCPQCIASN